MKARKRGTNDPFEEIDCLQFKDSYVLYKADMIEFENESKGNKSDVEYWEQLRHQAAIAAMQGLLANNALVYTNGDEKIGLVDRAIKYSNKLVEKLKKEKV